MTLFKWWSVEEVKHLLRKGVKSRTTDIFVIFFQSIFLKISVVIPLKVVNRTNEKFFLVNIFLACFFSCNYLSQKESFI